MKFEIDLNDREGLEAKAKELKSALELIQFALERATSSPVKQPIAARSKPATKKGVDSEFYKALPNKFTTTEAKAIALQVGMSKEAGRVAVIRWAEDGQILTLVEKGEGKNPNKYTKMEFPK